MASFKSNASYDMLISLCNKLMCLKGVITLRPSTDSMMSLAGYSQLQKCTTFSRGKNMVALLAPSSSQSTGLSLGMQRGPTLYLLTQAHTPRQHSQLEMQPHYESSM
jgi:hypothetical protein